MGHVVRVLTLALFCALTSASIAWSASCSDHADACVRHETAMSKPASRCAAPKRACLTACKQGKSASFVGPSSGTAFPATECR